MKKFKYNRWLLLFIVVGLLAALVVDVQRYQVEKQNMTVDMAIDYEGLVELAEREGLPPEEAMQRRRFSLRNRSMSSPPARQPSRVMQATVAIFRFSSFSMSILPPWASR